MKLYVNFEDIEDDQYKYTLKFTLPAKWYKLEVFKILEFYVKNYNSKFPDHPLDTDNYHVANKQRSISNSTIIEDIFINNEDIYIRKGPSPTKEVWSPPTPIQQQSQVQSQPQPQPQIPQNNTNIPSNINSTPTDLDAIVKCKNYGCNKTYKECENTENSCRYHVKPPFFHDTKKGWSCCSHRSVYDWAEFESLEGCTIGKHSQIDPKLKFAPSPTVQAALDAELKNPSAPVKTIDEYNQSNPEAPTALSSAISTASKTVPRKDGQGRCQHGGCQQWYNLHENSDTSCRHHSGKAVFHDRAKYWTCCSDKKAYDFDDFMKIQGCTTGPHDDGNGPVE